MRKIFLNLAILYISVASGSCQLHCDVKGTWQIKKGRLTQGYQRTGYKYSKNRVLFSETQVELASGFFYNILPRDSNDWALGRYPFVYYGNLEQYKIVNDTIQIYSKPYNRWKSFKIECIGNNEVRLLAVSDTIILVRDNNQKVNKECSIRSINVHVYERGLGLYANNYKASYLENDTLIFQQLSDKEPNVEAMRINLKPGTFENICRGLSQLNLSKFQKNYPSNSSEIEVKNIEIELADGNYYRFHLEDNKFPEELMLAFIPIFYGHQQYVYGQLPAVD